MLLEFHIAAANTNHKRIIGHIDIQSLRTNKIQVILDQHNWELDVQLLDIEFYLFFNLVAFSCLEFNRDIREQIITLIVKFGLGNTKLTKLAENRLFVLGGVIDRFFNEKVRLELGVLRFNFQSINTLLFHWLID